MPPNLAGELFKKSLYLWYSFLCNAREKFALQSFLIALWLVNAPSHSEVL